MSGAAIRRSGGRPTAQAAARLESIILEAATEHFLADGYAETTIEAVARACNVAKRTIYARWNGKPALFRSVIELLMAKWLSAAGDWTETASLEDALNQAAARILSVALTPEAVALNRLLIAESARFPELPMMLHQAGASQGRARIAALLDRAVEEGTLTKLDTAFAAEQFMHLVLAGPQHRALGLGPRLDENATDQWRKAAVELFLCGVYSSRLPRGQD